MQVLIYEVPTVVDGKIPVPRDYESSSSSISDEFIHVLKSLGNSKILAHLSFFDGNCRIVVTNSAGESRSHLQVYFEKTFKLDTVNHLQYCELEVALKQVYKQIDSEYQSFVKATQASVRTAEQDAKLTKLLRARSDLLCFA
jgi:hypothetical protein